MRNLLLTFLTALFLFQGCSSVKGLFGKKGIMDPDDPNFLENIQKLKNSYKGGNVQALNELVSMYQDENQQTKARVIAGKALAQSQHPTALRAISKMVETTTAVDFTLLKESIEMLGMFEENPKAAIAMVKAMHRLEDRTNEIHLALAKNLNKVRTKDQVLALLDLYEVSKANLSKTEKLLTEILGALGNDQVIPVLTTIAKDPRANVGIRNMAVEILGKKNPDDVAIAFAELLGDPNTNMEVREFALNTMKGVQEENLVLALLNTYNMGKSQYYSLLNTMLAALGEFDDPEVKKAVMEIANSGDYPVDIRKKAIDNLGSFKDPSVIEKVIPILENKDNYIYYDNILDMIYVLGKEQTYAETVRRMAFKAHYDKREHE
ncbi:MAG: HEAT repeat domain-containing protein [Candidatus Neomarinimicrobiota bacterium]|nr:HEAT repeat domain-containing protein [Candidatus Neomarinimicrobiota bacterium]MED5427948.1 HEAT repeat domain-containing protein [Candidatus Neomarinimicrobiota bacterium]